MNKAGSRGSCREHRDDPAATSLSTWNVAALWEELKVLDLSELSAPSLSVAWPLQAGAIRSPSILAAAILQAQSLISSLFFVSRSSGHRNKEMVATYTRALGGENKIMLWRAALIPAELLDELPKISLNWHSAYSCVYERQYHVCK